MRKNCRRWSTVARVLHRARAMSSSFCNSAWTRWALRVIPQVLLISSLTLFVVQLWVRAWQESGRAAAEDAEVVAYAQLDAQQVIHTVVWAAGLHCLQ